MFLAPCTLCGKKFKQWRGENIHGGRRVASSFYGGLKYGSGVFKFFAFEFSVGQGLERIVEGWGPKYPSLATPVHSSVQVSDVGWHSW